MRPKPPYIRVFTKREQRWLSLEEYFWRYKATVRDVMMARSQSVNPYVNDMVAALQSVKGGTYIPSYPSSLNGAPSLANVLLNATVEKIAFIGASPANGEVAKGIFRTAGVTTGATMDLRLETVDEVTTGDPTGTLLDTNSNVAVVIADADDNKTFISTFTATATITMDQLFALVLVNPVASFGTMNISTFSDEVLGFPYVDHFTTAWAKGSAAAVAGLVYSGDVYYPIPGFWPIGTTSAGGAAFTTLTVSSSTTPDEVGNIFQFPYPGEIQGYWVWVTATGDFDMKLYDNAGTELKTSTVKSVARTTTQLIIKRFFTSPYEFAANTNVRLVVKPTTTTSLSLYEFDVPAAAALDHFEGGQLMHKTSRTDAGSFSQVTTKRLLMGVLVNKYSDGAGAGGGGVISKSLIAGGA